MSVLAYPRLHFRGECVFNPATGNNDDVVVNGDAVNVALRPELAALSDDEIRAHLISGYRAIHPFNQNLQWYLRCGWNYMGDMSVTFPKVAVCATTGVDGRTTTSDALVGGDVGIGGSPAREAHKRLRALGAVLCDLDPTGSALTQIFLGDFRVGGGEVGLSAVHDARAHGRWVLFRNSATYQGEQNYPAAGAVWQFAIPADALRFQGLARSPVLADLQAAATAARGIVVRFAALLPEPQFEAAELIARFEAGEFVQNPAEALVVGTVGVWEDGELETAFADRLLMPSDGPPHPATVLGPAGYYLGPATARVQRDRDVVSLDLIAAFPEHGYDRPPVKADLRTVRLGWVPPGGGPAVPIGDALTYDYATYEETGGILDVAYDPNATYAYDLERGELVLLSEDPSTGSSLTILSESGSTFTVETDDRGVYLDPGEGGAIAVLVREKGGPPGRDVTVRLWEYQSRTIPETVNRRAGSELVRVSAATGLRSRVRFAPSVVFPRGRSRPLAVPITAMRPGAAVLALTLDGHPPPASRPWGLNSYAAVRVLPHDSYFSVPPEERVSWEFMYRTVFRYYHLVFPAMSQMIDFSDEEVMAERADLLVAASDPRLRNNTCYMPPSRDLSAGKRALIMEWAAARARQREADGVPRPPPAPKSTAGGRRGPGAAPGPDQSI